MPLKSEISYGARPTSRGAGSAHRAFRVLHALAREAGGLTAHEVADACAIPRSSVYQLLNVMREHRVVGYDPSQRVWSLDVGTLEIGAAYLRNDGLQQKSWRHLVRLTSATGFTSHLAILDGPEVVYLGKREPSGGGIRLVTEVGTRLPARSAAVGKAILAHLTPTELSFLHGPGVNGGIQEPADFHEFVRELQAVRHRGYAQDTGQITPGITCVAAPVIAEGGRVTAAIGVSYVSAAVSDMALHALTITHVQQSARELSRDFVGYDRNLPTKLPD